MGNDIRKEKGITVNRGHDFRWYVLPLAIMLLGLLSLVMFLWIRTLHEEQRADFSLVDALKDIQIKTAVVHLWFEEASVERKKAYYETAWSNLAEAQRLSEVILRGGETEYGQVGQLFRNRSSVLQAEKANRLLIEFDDLAHKRYANPEAAGIGSELDERFDHVFGEILGAVGALEDIAERKLRSDYTKMTRLFVGTIIAWTLIVTAATLGLGGRETKRRQAEEALEKATDELETKVGERTEELRVANEQLRLELSERKRAEEEKAMFQKGAERAARLAAVGELMAGMAHEINNPVSGIINCSEILVNKTLPESREHDLGRRILKEGERIAFIVQGLLSFSRKETEEKIPVRIREILADTLVLAEAQLQREGTRLEVDLDGDSLAVLAQPQRLQQVFMNIINNARDALNQKYPKKAEGKMLRITAGPVNANGRPQVRIKFHDRGTGIPAQVIDRVMDPFFSTKPKGKGTGLGLSISQGIVANYGGTLTLESVEGEFTDVAVELPLLESG